MPGLGTPTLTTPLRVDTSSTKTCSLVLVTPPTTTPAQFGSPLIANGNYSPMPGSAPHTPWGMNALSLSPLPSDGGFSYAPSPMMASDCGGTEYLTTPLSAHSQPGMEMGYGYVGTPGLYRRDQFGMDIGLGVKPVIIGADGQPAPEIKKRSRTAQACERCRIRKARVSKLAVASCTVGGLGRS